MAIWLVTLPVQYAQLPAHARGKRDMVCRRCLGDFTHNSAPEVSAARTELAANALRSFAQELQLDITVRSIPISQDAESSLHACLCIPRASVYYVKKLPITPLLVMKAHICLDTTNTIAFPSRLSVTRKPSTPMDVILC